MHTTLHARALHTNSGHNLPLAFPLSLVDPTSATKQPHNLPRALPRRFIGVDPVGQHVRDEFLGKVQPVLDEICDHDGRGACGARAEEGDDPDRSGTGD